MKTKKLQFFTALIFMLFSAQSVVNGYSIDYIKPSNNGYKEPTLTNSLNFKAKLENNKVQTNWSEITVPNNETFKRYKVVRSNKNADPVYPDDSYIQAYSSINNTSHIDASPKPGVNYYRVCLITQELGRYCSNVEKIIIENENSENKNNNYTNSNFNNDNKKENNSVNNAKFYTYCDQDCSLNRNRLLIREDIKKIGISQNRSKILINKINNLIVKLEKKIDDKEKRISKLNTIIEKLNTLASNKPQYKNTIDFMVLVMKDIIEQYKTTDIDSEIDDILNDI